MEGTGKAAKVSRGKMRAAPACKWGPNSMGPTKDMTMSSSQQPKQEGGLGVRDLATHNACLLLKLLHRLHHPEDSAWAIWARRSTDMISMKGPADGNHWKGFRHFYLLTDASPACRWETVLRPPPGGTHGWVPLP